MNKTEREKLIERLEKELFSLFDEAASYMNRAKEVSQRIRILQKENKSAAQENIRAEELRKKIKLLGKS